MTYDLANLAPPDFEDLVSDLMSAELGFRFELFAVGPDGSIDGRHLEADGATIIQAKQYVRSNFAKLKSVMKAARPAIDRLKAKRYILATACPLTPANKSTLAKIIGPSLKSESDILGPQDIQVLLRKYPDVTKSQFKLWLSGTAMLEQIIRAASVTVNKITEGEIREKVRVYTPNPSFIAAQATLDQHHVVIISGPPGVGKTTLAEMLCYAFMADNWELTTIRNLDDGFAAIKDYKKQVFYFDDFLGMVALDKQALARTDSDLSRFLSRVRKSPNARFVLTTRAYIFEEATRASEKLANAHLDIAKYVLDVGIYTRRIKSRILYNHLLVSGTPHDHVAALVQSSLLPSIIDHPNYNPRIIEWMTDGAHLDKIAAADYPKAFKQALDQPGRLWDIAFRTHIARMCQHLLICLFFTSEYGAEVTRLRVLFNCFHPRMCNRYKVSSGPTDFDDALQILEGGFIEIRASTVRFINPSLRDFLSEYLKDMSILIECAACLVDTFWPQSVWAFCSSERFTENQRKEIALGFLPMVGQLITLPVWKRVQTKHGHTISIEGLANTRRIELLLSLGDASGEVRFRELALLLATTPIDGGFDSWPDGRTIVELISKLPDDCYYSDFPQRDEILSRLEEGLRVMLSQHMSIDELDTIAGELQECDLAIQENFQSALNEAVSLQIDEMKETIKWADSESTLQEQYATFEKLASQANLSEDSVKRIERLVDERLESLSSEELSSEAPTLSPTAYRSEEKFSNAALVSLFASLLEE